MTKLYQLSLVATFKLKTQKSYSLCRYTVEPLIAATFTAKVRWPLLGGGCYSEVCYIGKPMGKRLGLKVSGRYRDVAAIRRWPHLEV